MKFTNCLQTSLKLKNLFDIARIRNSSTKCGETKVPKGCEDLKF